MVWWRHSSPNRPVYAHDRFGDRYQHASEQASPLSYIPVEAADVDRSTNRLLTPATGVEYDYAGNVTRDPKFRPLQYAHDANGRTDISCFWDVVCVSMCAKENGHLRDGR